MLEMLEMLRESGKIEASRDREIRSSPYSYARRVPSLRSMGCMKKPWERAPTRLWKDWK